MQTPMRPISAASRRAVPITPTSPCDEAATPSSPSLGALGAGGGAFSVPRLDLRPSQRALLAQGAVQRIAVRGARSIDPTLPSLSPGVSTIATGGQSIIVGPPALASAERGSTARSLPWEENNVAIVAGEAPGPGYPPRSPSVDGDDLA
mmetsp:Transcript_18904/g.48730  ORF Transcript_18904/g.48730 Transcript_18904/m.48730 type:complete len:149 (+) Transcript_18904:3-449(+)